MMHGSQMLTIQARWRYSYERPQVDELWRYDRWRQFMSCRLVPGRYVATGLLCYAWCDHRMKDDALQDLAVDDIVAHDGRPSRWISSSVVPANRLEPSDTSLGGGLNSLLALARPGAAKKETVFLRKG